MAISHINDLRVTFPSHFRNRDPVLGEEKIIRIPTNEPDSTRRRRRFDEEDGETEAAQMHNPDLRDVPENADDPAHELEEALTQFPPMPIWIPYPTIWLASSADTPAD